MIKERGKEEGIDGKKTREERKSGDRGNYIEKARDKGKRQIVNIFTDDFSTFISKQKFASVGI